MSADVHHGLLGRVARDLHEERVVRWQGALSGGWPAWRLAGRARPVVDASMTAPRPIRPGQAVRNVVRLVSGGGA